MTSDRAVLDDIINNLLPDQIPSRYVLAAKYVYPDGREDIIEASKVDETRADMKRRARASELQVIIDILAVREDLIEEINSFFENLHIELEKDGD